jgi:hypothetical protein
MGIGATLKIMQGVEKYCCITHSKVRCFMAMGVALYVKLVLFKYLI